MRQRLLVTVLLLTAPALLASPDPGLPMTIDGATTVSAEELIMLANERSELVIIDSRIANNRQHGYLDGSVSLPDEETDCDQLERVVPSETHPVLFYCNGVKCGRSAKAVRVALDCGYNQVYWFRGGFVEWRDKGYAFTQ